MGSEVNFVTDEQRLRPEGSEVFRLCCDNQKYCELTNSGPEITLEEGLQRTIDWFTRSENLSRYKSGLYNV